MTSFVGGDSYHKAWLTVAKFKNLLDFAEDLVQISADELADLQYINLICELVKKNT